MTAGCRVCGGLVVISRHIGAEVLPADRGRADGHQSGVCRLMGALAIGLLALAMALGLLVVAAPGAVDRSSARRRAVGDGPASGSSTTAEPGDQHFLGTGRQ